ALLGRARARLDLARLPGQPVDLATYAAAEADAAQVPTGFAYNIPYNAAAFYSQNNIVQRNRLSLLYGVAPSYRNLGDPRVQVTKGPLGADAVDTVWLANKYPALNTPIPLATWREARLIIAEAELAAGNVTTAIATLDSLRGRAGVGLPPYSGAIDPDSVRAYLITGRPSERFAAGHRVWDINRVNLPLNRP